MYSPLRWIVVGCGHMHPCHPWDPSFIAEDAATSAHPLFDWIFSPVETHR
jgi:hypothetical protein